MKPRPVYGIDSETVNDTDGRAKCTLIACSDGTHLARPSGISTAQALHYITRRNGELWTFFGDYDVNFWLRDMPQSRLDRLRRKGWAVWGIYRVHHIPRRVFEVWDLRSGHFSRVFDVFPFIQSSFVAWLENWNLADPKTVARIRAMKERRGEFVHVAPSKILRYTRDEVKYLAIGVERLKERVRAAGFAPAQWLGPGAVAAHAMRAHDVKLYLPRKAHPRAEIAYYGGRIETARVGVVQGPLWYYDIASAYPAACTTLPCFAHGAWHRTTKPQGVALVYVRWQPRAGARPIWGPFPTRPQAGSTLRYYAQGAGWYWLDEVLPWLESRDYAVQIGTAYQWHQKCAHRPFAWVAEMYEKRATLKRAGDPAEYALKLILNSIYGKLAQRVGSRPYYCPAWAGLITARTRARLGVLLNRYGRSVILVATDGILLDRELSRICKPGLGGWTLEGTYTHADIWQPGFYVLSDGKMRTRGYSRVDVDPADIRKAWNANGLTASVPLRKEHVVGYRLATARGTLEDFCRWTLNETSLSLNPLPRRFPDVVRNGVVRTVAPQSLAFERASGVATLKRDMLTALEEDGCPDGFYRD